MEGRREYVGRDEILKLGETQYVVHTSLSKATFLFPKFQDMNVLPDVSCWPPLNSPELVVWKENNNTVPILNYTDPVALRAFQEPDSLERFAVLQDTGEVVSIPMRDGYSSALRVYKPTPPIQQSALVVLAFGGGFVCGDNRQLAGYAIGLRELYGATVVLLSYRLAPENPFPVSQNDTWDSLV